MGIYSGINDYLDKIYKSIKSQKISRAKQDLGDLFMYLCDYMDVINEEDYNAIKQFKNILLDNIKYPPLFGKTVLNNDKLVLASYKQCHNIIQSKVDEFNGYLESFIVSTAC